MKRPRLITKCEASAEAIDGERIAEFRSTSGAGLVSLLEDGNGRLIVSVYNCTGSVIVLADNVGQRETDQQRECRETGGHYGDNQGFCHRCGVAMGVPTI